jgi:hypothetical protein
MSKKTVLVITAAVELCLGAYFMLAFFAWCAKLFIFNSGKSQVSLMLAGWTALAATCFVLYNRTRRKIRKIEETEAQVRSIDLITETQPAPPENRASTADAQSKPAI